MQEILFTYVAQQTPEENKEILLETTKELQYFSEGGKNAMTMAESLVKDGRDENMRNVVRSMLKEGADQEFVQRVTGLTAEKIAAVLAEKNEV